MGLILVFALSYGTVILLVEPYRQEWQAEQKALKEIRAKGHRVGYTTIRVGPTWLHRLAWGRRPYFDRVKILYFVAGGQDEYRARRSAFHHVKLVVQD